MMILRKVTLEYLLYTLAFLLALAVRLIALGSTPLSETEATRALSALAIIRPEAGGQEASDNPLALPAPAPTDPAYTLLTGAIFALFSASDAPARLVPALAGSALALLPLLFRRRLGPGAALVLAMGLALDPGLVTVSRQAGSPLPALLFTMLALGLWLSTRQVLAGVSAGLALLCGPYLLTGALGLALAWGAVRGLKLFRRHTAEPISDVQPAPTAGWAALLGTGGALLLGGTLFAVRPSGLAGLFDGLAVWLAGWAQPSGIPAARLLAVLAVYALPALVFGAITAGRALFTIRRPSPAQAEIEIWPDGSPFLSREGGRVDRFLILSLLAWFLAALLTALLYPARQVSDLIWALPPLWALAALEIAPLFASRTPSIFWFTGHDPAWAATPESSSVDDSAVSWGEAVLLFILLALFWLTLSGLNLNLPGLSGTGIRAAILGGILLLGALAVGLVALGWSWPVARAGLYAGLLISLGVYLIGVMWGAAFTRQNAPQELWSLAPAPGQVRLVEATLHQISTWRTGFPQDLEVVVTLDSQSLRWTLRDFPGVRYVNTPPSGELPEVIITAAEGAPPALASAYRGQDFAWQVWPGWNGALPPDEARWVTFREAPLIQNSLILWARSDLFPGGTVDEQP